MSAYSGWNIPFVNETITELDGTPLVAAANTDVVTAFEPTADTWQTPVIANHPRIFGTTGRGLQLVVVDANSSMTLVTVKGSSTDQKGRTFNFFFEQATPGTNVYTITDRPAYTITELLTLVNGVVTGGADTIQVRCTDVLGLIYDIAASSDIEAARVDNAIEATPTLSVSNRTWTPATAPNGTRVFALTGRSTSTA